ncbi:tetratricopeptide repeat protein [Ekhidna sp.]
MKKAIFITLLLISVFAEAQIIRESELLRRMDKGAELMAKGQYDTAQVLFQSVLQNMDKLPSQVAYYFGRNSFHLGKYKQSINWLNKYIQLKGTKGRYYEPAITYLQYAEDEYLKIQRSQAKQFREDLEDANYDCGGLEKMLCPVCHGSGVVVQAGIFDEVYKTCPYSLGEGYLSCEEYNLFMRGDLDAKVGN